MKNKIILLPPRDTGTFNDGNGRQYIIDSNGNQRITGYRTMRCPSLDEIEAKRDGIIDKLSFGKFPCDEDE